MISKIEDPEDEIIAANACKIALERILSYFGLGHTRQDSDLIGYVDAGEIAAIAAENTYLMGRQAVLLIAESWEGKPIPARSVAPPLLITRQNLKSAESNLFTGYPR